MGNLTTALVFVLALNVLLFLSQATMLDISDDSNLIYTGKGTVLEQLAKDGELDNPQLDSSRLTQDMPNAEKDVNPETGNFFTDGISSLKAWLTDKLGLDYVYNIVKAPYNMLKLMKLPDSFVFAIGSLWYGVTFFLIVAFIMGRDS